jgi:hypothetical protein
MITTFITILAWIFGTFFTIFTILRIIASCRYTDTQRIIDAANGRIITFPIGWPVAISVICWSWIMATYII